MSRHHLVALDPAHEVVVGSDRPLRTFFAQVTDVTADEDSDARTVLWIGGDRGRRCQTLLRPSFRALATPKRRDEERPEQFRRGCAASNEELG